MMLTPQAVRVDKKCGNSAVPDTKKCYKGTSNVKAKQKTLNAQRLTNGLLLAAGAVGTVAVINGVARGRARSRLIAETAQQQQAIRLTRLSELENRQREVARSREAAIAGIYRGPSESSSATQTAPRYPASYYPQTQEERAVNNAWRAQSRTKRTKPHSNPNPDVSAAWKRDSPWAVGFDAEDGKKYTKTVTNPETGRKNKVRYGAKGYTIAPGTDKGDRYCARSFGDMKSHGKDCSGPDRNTPLCLSRAKWKCSGKSSRRS